MFGDQRPGVVETVSDFDLSLISIFDLTPCDDDHPGPSPQTAEAGDTPFSSGTAVASRSQEGSTPVGWGHGNYGGLHLYRRQFGDGAADAGCPQQSSFSCLQQVCCPVVLLHSYI